MREIEVLRLIANGATNREIAEQLVISEGTVKNHVSNILNHLGLRDRTQAAIYARENGLLLSIDVSKKIGAVQRQSFFTHLFNKIQRSSRQDIDRCWERVFIDVEAWMVVREGGLLRGIARADDEVATGDGVEEDAHVIAARCKHVLARIDMLFANGGNGGIVDQFRHRGIIDAGRTTIETLNLATSTHRNCHTCCNLGNAPQ